MDCIGNLTKLTSMYVDASVSSDSITNFEKPATPSVMAVLWRRPSSLSDNNITGTIPASVGSLRQLVYLCVHQFLAATRGHASRCYDT